MTIFQSLFFWVIERMELRWCFLLLVINSFNESQKKISFCLLKNSNQSDYNKQTVTMRWDAAIIRHNSNKKYVVINNGKKKLIKINKKKLISAIFLMMTMYFLCAVYCIIPSIILISDTLKKSRKENSKLIIGSKWKR